MWLCPDADLEVTVAWSRCAKISLTIPGHPAETFYNHDVHPQGTNKYKWNENWSHLNLGYTSLVKYRYLKQLVPITGLASWSCYQLQIYRDNLYWLGLHLGQALHQYSYPMIFWTVGSLLKCSWIPLVTRLESSQQSEGLLIAGGHCCRHLALSRSLPSFAFSTRISNSFPWFPNRSYLHPPSSRYSTSSRKMSGNSNSSLPYSSCSS